MRSSRNSGTAMRSGRGEDELAARRACISASISRFCLTVSVESMRQTAMPHVLHLVDLILDESDQRGDDHGDAGQDQRGQLIEQGLAATGGHHGEEVFAGENVGRASRWPMRKSSMPMMPLGDL